MDAVKFIDERRRMFAETGGLAPKRNIFDKGCSAEDVVKEVEEWSAAHPRKTRQSVFLEQYPGTILDVFGVLRLCPARISAAYRRCDGECKNPEKVCSDCRREFWMQEVE